MTRRDVIWNRMIALWLISAGSLGYLFSGTRGVASGLLITSTTYFLLALLELHSMNKEIK